MYGIEFKSGINDCYFNCEGKCVNKKVTRKKTNMSCDWESKQNCTFTQIGTELCSGYMKQSFIEYPNLQRTTANTMVQNGGNTNHVRPCQKNAANYKTIQSRIKHAKAES
jgi:hypothetical protein